MNSTTTLAIAGAIVAAAFAMPAVADQHATQTNTQKSSTQTTTGTHDTHSPAANGVATKTSDTTHEDTTSSEHDNTTSKNEHGPSEPNAKAQGETKATKTQASPH